MKVSGWHEDGSSKGGWFHGRKEVEGQIWWDGWALDWIRLDPVPIWTDLVGSVQIRHNSPRQLNSEVLDTVEDKGLEAVASNCHMLEELRVFPADPFDQDFIPDGGGNGVTDAGFVSVSEGCPNLHYVLYFCRKMTNAAVATVVRNCPNFTHFRLCIMNMCEPDYLTNDPMDEAFGSVVRTCKELRRLAVSGLLTDRTFEYIGTYAKKLETLSVAFAGNSDRSMQYVMQGCPNLRKLEIRDCPFGNTALLSGLERYESMRSLWMSACNVTMNGCRVLAREMPRLNVEVIKEEDSDGVQAEKVYVYRTVVGPRRDAPPFVLTL
ncbi:Protein AUXIN SIGNALING F-BOX 2 [Platanthera guangdongensis]|uniref:Protein AUXIN SIGNALING F-BOX 2 n=1 Tax=Platanthera guangdongensis TaxID=2320717 RepID=A0ABR2MWZ1_9ASPA